MPATAVLLLAFGGPETLADVAPFLARLTGRTLAPAAVDRVVERYRTIGGGSPLSRLVQEQACALERELSRSGATARVNPAFRYAPPDIPSVVARLVGDGYTKFIALSNSPHYARITTGAYLDALRSAASEYGATVLAADPYFAHPEFMDALAAQARAAIASTQSSDRPFLVFTAHSLPRDEIAANDRYVVELHTTITGVVERLHVRDWAIAYQSKGMGQGEWLEPALEDVLRQVAATGNRTVVVCPVGFTTDHVETLYDLDVMAAAAARDLSLNFRRAAALNAHPAFIRALASVVRPHLN